jgi:DNA repair exonuclease SbcCD nuclease subunit
MIKKIVHISDIHIRTNEYHDLYETQFEILVDDLKEQTKGYEKSEIRICITGDIAHTKINISNEQIILTAKLFNLLTKIGIVVILPGNHDFLEKNHERLDSITPIVSLIDDQKSIIYYKDSGVYEDENVKWVIYSLYQHNVKPEYVKEDGLYVGLFHGPIQGLSTDLGFTFEDSYSQMNFVGLDLLLCGDIHKRQTFTLPGGGKGVMIGSLIQQNFAETVNHHGYGMYDVEKGEYSFHDLKNERPFLHFSITDIKDLEDGKETLLNLG